jgi:hypothetical protein
MNEEKGLRLRLNSKKPDDSEVTRHIRREIGSMTYVSGITGKARQKTYHVGIVMERHLWDDLRSEFRVKMLRFPSMFSVRLEFDTASRSYSLIAPERGEIVRHVNSRLSGYRLGSESTLLKAIGEKMIHISQIQDQMNPLFEIVNYISRRESVTAADFVSLGRTHEKAERYLNFLASVDVLKREDGTFVKGPVYEKRLEDPFIEGLYYSILSEAIKKGYTYMQHFLNFTHITPFIRLGNASYLSSFQADRILALNAHDLNRHLIAIYSAPELLDSKIDHRAHKMVEVGIFDVVPEVPTAPEYYTAHEEIYTQYVDLWKGRNEAFVEN